MWQVLEQYGFLKTLFSFNTERIREAAFWGIVVNLIMMVTGVFNYWANEILGMSAAVALMIFIIMFFDLITGVFAASSEGEVICSKKGLRWVFKFGSYTVFVYVLNMLVHETQSYSFEWLAYPMNIIKLFTIFTIAFWELKSIDENFERMGYSFGIFKLLDPIYRIFKGVVKKNADIDIDEAINEHTERKSEDDK